MTGYEDVPSCSSTDMCLPITYVYTSVCKKTCVTFDLYMHHAKQPLMYSRPTMGWACIMESSTWLIECVQFWLVTNQIPVLCYPSLPRLPWKECCFWCSCNQYEPLELNWRHLSGPSVGTSLGKSPYNTLGRYVMHSFQQIIIIKQCQHENLHFLSLALLSIVVCT